MEEEPPSPQAEFFMAIAGPLSSILIGIVFYVIRLTGQAGDWPAFTIGVFSYLSFLNFLLAGFNLVPAFPLDGGRRSIYQWYLVVSYRAVSEKCISNVL
jgi:Zn-dependent protease